MNKTSALSPLAGAAKASAIALYAKPSPGYTAQARRGRSPAAARRCPGRSHASQQPGREHRALTDMIRRLQLPMSVFVLETGRLHTETLALLERAQALEGIEVQVFRPKQEAVIQFIRTQGQDAIYNSVAQRKHCCDIRKMEPLSRALAGKKGWITGLRREQSNARAEVPQVDESEQASKGLTKFNPLADSNAGDVSRCVLENRVDYNPLHDQFYPSIGCAPCTRAVTVGEDFRSGRWWWEDEAAKECGLHVKKPTPAQPQKHNEETPA